MATSSSNWKRRKHIIAGSDGDANEEHDSFVEVDDQGETGKSGQQSCDREREDTQVDSENVRTRKNTSEVWKHFTRIGKKDNKEKATCNYCGQEYVVGSKKTVSDAGDSVAESVVAYR